MAKTPSKEQIKATRGERNAVRVEELKAQNAPAEAARLEQAEAVQGNIDADRQAQLDQAVADEEAERASNKKMKIVLHDGKPGSGAGLRPGDWHAPASNPGAAARVPNQPLQPESMQSHGLGILHDKDLANPPYDTGDPAETDAGPAGSGSPSNIGVSRGVDKEAERNKAEKATAAFRANDPDNPTVGASGEKGDATASPHPIGTRGNRRDTAGGSNSGSKSLRG